ncbi:MAG: hypothetical protein DRH37_04095 [Deltaproteobacteria bacterium]|nr:MAG: hypothetical protein DRH37_04095 [Deltaproteobacteria bacterium]
MVAVKLLFIAFFVFMFFLSTTGSTTSNSYYYFSKQTIIAGCPGPIQEIVSYPVIEEPHNIPLRTQTDTACGSVSLAMAIDWLGKPYHNQKWYDICVGRSVNESIFSQQIKICANKCGVRARIHGKMDVSGLEVGDIVQYHAYGYQNDTDSHFSVVDYIFEDRIVLANPWGCYDCWNYTGFVGVFTGEIIRLSARMSG